MGIELTFEIVFRSNYHVGAGYGKGFNVDSAILRDADGTPVIRGSMLAGLLRDSASRLLQLPPLALAQHNKKDEVLARLFGSSHYPKRWAIGSARPNQPLAKKRDSQIARRVRIDPRTRRAEPRKLFSQEEGVAGQVFKFTMTCPDADESALDEAAFLVAAARNVRQLGRSRRRGLGECSIHLTDVKGVSANAVGDWQDWLLERFSERWLKAKPAEQPKPPKQTDFALDAESLPHYHGKPVRLRLIIRLDEPLLIARRAPAGNHFEARNFIPGRVILGALASIAARHNRLMQDEVYRDFVLLFLRGGITFSSLYPALFSENYLYPTIPAPLGLLTCSIVPFSEQDDGHGTYSYFAGTPEKCPKCNEKEVESRLEPISGFIVLRRKGTHVFVPKRSSELHIQINEETGRVQKSKLYGYTVLEAGQYFVGEIQCANEEAWEQLKAMTGIEEEQPLSWRLGKARRRGYGKVTAWLERFDDQRSDWIQLPLPERVKDPSQLVSLTLLTDTIVQNRWGQQAVSFHEHWLEETLGLGKLHIKDAYVRSRIVDGFNNHLGLPRWRDTALVAGSVVWFTLEKPPADWQARMAQLEREGIGLRRNEGFGRIAFNHPVYNRRDALRRSSIRLEQPMRLGDKPGTDKFMERWEKKLADVLPARLDARFAALARWLHAHSDQSPQEILSFLNAKFDDEGKGFHLERVFGEPDERLIEEVIGQQEYGARSKSNFFSEDKDGKAVMLKICALLQELGKDETHQREGIQRLAGYLSAAATEKEEVK